MTDSGRAQSAEPAGQVITVFVAAPLCRRCVRIVSRQISDVPGVVALEVDAAAGRLRIRGGVDHGQLLAAIRSAGFAVGSAPNRPAGPLGAGVGR
jgi:copper chaperone CopZ